MDYLTKVFAEMSSMVLIIVIALSIMALASLSVFVERLFVFRRARLRSREFALLATRRLEAGEYEGLEREALERKGDLLAQLVGGGVKTYRQAMADRGTGAVGAVELARRELGRKADDVAAQVRRGLGVLASVGSIAPFVGLLGTVVGILGAFQSIGATGSAGLGAVASDIGEALIVTAFGLAIAIPVVLMFNFLTARADSLLMALDSAKGQLIDYIEAHHDDGALEVRGRPREVIGAA
jgi:biopolymer transport protein ExbB